MPTYILMTKLSPDSIKDSDDRKGKGKVWLEKVHQSCPEVTWVAHYALLGRYDFMDIFEAPGDETAHVVSLISRQAGAVSAESWPAISYEKHLELFDRVVG